MKTFATVLATFATAMVIASTADGQSSLSCTAVAQATTPQPIYARGTGPSYDKAHAAAIAACKAQGGENCSIYHSWCVANSEVR